MDAIKKLGMNFVMLISAVLLLLSFFLPWTELYQIQVSGFDLARPDLFLIPATAIFFIICWYKWRLDASRIKGIIWCAGMILINYSFFTMLFTGLGTPAPRGLGGWVWGWSYFWADYDYGFILSMISIVVLFVCAVSKDLLVNRKKQLKPDYGDGSDAYKSNIIKAISKPRAVLILSCLLIFGSLIVMLGFFLPWQDWTLTDYLWLPGGARGLENASGYDISNGFQIGESWVQIAPLFVTILCAMIVTMIIGVLWILMAHFLRTRPFLFRLSWNIALMFDMMMSVTIVIFYTDILSNAYDTQMKIGWFLSVIGTIATFISLLLIGLGQRYKYGGN